MDEEFINNIIEEIESLGENPFTFEYEEQFTELLKNPSNFPPVCEIFSKVSSILHKKTLAKIILDNFNLMARLLDTESLNFCFTHLTDFLKDPEFFEQDEELEEYVFNIIAIIYRQFIEQKMDKEVNVCFFPLLSKLSNPNIQKMTLRILKDGIIDINNNPNLMNATEHSNLKKYFKEEQIVFNFKVSLPFLYQIDPNVNEALVLVIECFKFIAGSNKVFFPPMKILKMINKDVVERIFKLIGIISLKMSEKAFTVLHYMLSISKSAFKTEEENLMYVEMFTNCFPLIFSQPKDNSFILPLAMLYLDISRLMPLNLFISKSPHSNIFFLNAYQVTINQSQLTVLQKSDEMENVLLIYLNFWSKIALTCIQSTGLTYPKQLSGFIFNIFERYVTLLMSEVLNNYLEKDYFSEPFEDISKLEPLWNLLWADKRLKWLQNKFFSCIDNLKKRNEMNLAIVEASIFVFIFSSCFISNTYNKSKYIQETLIKDIVLLIDVSREANFPKNLKGFSKEIFMFEKILLNFSLIFLNNDFIFSLDDSIQTKVFNSLINRVVEDFENFKTHANIFNLVLQNIESVLKQSKFSNLVKQNKALQEIIRMDNLPDLSMSFEKKERKKIIPKFYEIIGSNIRTEKDAKKIIQKIKEKLGPCAFAESLNENIALEFFLMVKGILASCKSPSSFREIVGFILDEQHKTAIVTLVKNSKIEVKKIVLSILDIIIGNKDKLIIKSNESLESVTNFISICEILETVANNKNLKNLMRVMKIISKLIKEDKTLEILEFFDDTYPRKLFDIFFSSLKYLQRNSQFFTIENNTSIVDAIYIFERRFSGLFFQDNMYAIQCLKYIKIILINDSDVKTFNKECKFIVDIFNVCIKSNDEQTFALVKNIHIAIFDVIINGNKNFLKFTFKPFYKLLIYASETVSTLFDGLKEDYENCEEPLAVVEEFLTSIDQLVEDFRDEETGEVSWPEEPPKVFCELVTNLHTGLDKFPASITTNEKLIQAI